MSTIPTSVTQKQFEKHIRPYLVTAKRGYECKISLHKVFNYILYHLHTGCQWSQIPIQEDCATRKKEISWQAVYYHWQKWNRLGCFEQIWKHSLDEIRDDLNCTYMNLDGTHTLAKKGGESVVYQYRKRAKTSNILPISDANGFILASTGIIAGNRHDSFNLKPHLQTAFKSMKRLAIPIEGAYFNADAAFDTKEARKVCFNYGVIPNIDLNKRNQKRTKRGRKRFFNKTIYKKRFSTERTFAWIDKFRALRLRDDRKDSNFLGAHHLCFALINMRHLFNH